jgi:hypothetical protein
MSNPDEFLINRLKEISCELKDRGMRFDDPYGEGFMDGLMIGQLSEGGVGYVKTLASAIVKCVSVAVGRWLQ